MRCGSTAGSPNILVEIIDPTVIDEMPAGVKHCNFRCNLHQALSHQHMLRIAQRRNLVAVFPFMIVDRFRGFRLTGINQPKRHLARMFCTQFLDCRRVAIGDRAIRAHKHQYDNFPHGRFERIHRISSEIETSTLRTSRCRSERSKPCRRDHNSKKRDDSEGVPTAAHSCPHQSGLQILQRPETVVEEISETGPVYYKNANAATAGRPAARPSCVLYRVTHRSCPEAASSCPRG